LIINSNNQRDIQNKAQCLTKTRNSKRLFSMILISVIKLGLESSLYSHSAAWVWWINGLHNVSAPRNLLYILYIFCSNLHKIYFYQIYFGNTIQIYGSIKLTKEASRNTSLLEHKLCKYFFNQTFRDITQKYISLRMRNTVQHWCKMSYSHVRTLGPTSC
jgi:hypothetical protein